MGRLSTDELAAVLIEKNGLLKKDAQNFVTAVFDVIKDGIEKDRLVKVKGLGTFKVVGVDARESVNVNTGERVLIDSHSKISFTADSMMKELVNKPFSGFETVVLNEGVEFDDMPASSEVEPLITGDDDIADSSEDMIVESVETEEQITPSEDLTAQVEEETVPSDDRIEQPIVEFVDDENGQANAQEEESILIVEPESAITEETPSVDEPAPSVEESVTSVEETAPSIDEATPSVAEDIPSVEESTPSVEESAPFKAIEQNEQTEETMTKKSNNWLLVLLSMIAGIGIGYIIRDFKESSLPVVRENLVEVTTNKVVSDTVKALPTETVAADSSKVKEQPSSNDTQTKVNTEKEVNSKEVAEKVTEKVKKPAPAAEPDYMKYEAMDARLRHGAYYIVGTASVEKVRPGDNLERISRRYLGKDMQCYMEVFNGITPSTTLKEGQDIKIPKLMTKKAMKERLARQKN